MNILSIHDGHNASAAILNNGIVLACITEERLNREKFYWGWPDESIKHVLAVAGITLDDVNVVTVSHLNTVDYIKRKYSLKENLTLKPKFVLGHVYNIWTTFKREVKIKSFFKSSGKKEFFFCDHHLGHASSTYYYSGLKDALVVTIDGQGDGLSHTAYDVKNGEWQLITNGGSNESLGAFYAALTEGLGFKPNRHEGKIVGLAAFADYKKIAQMDDGFFVKISEDKMHFSRKGYQKMIDKVKGLLDAGYTKEEVASYGQYLLEKLVTQHITELCKMTNQENIAIAGGVFSNVKLNQKISEQCPIKKIFVQPAMGDEGIVLGAAAYYIDKFGGGFNNQPMGNVYFGCKYADDDVALLLDAQKRHYAVLDSPAMTVAKMINDRKIIGWFDGSMEFGPRALGSRSIMAHPARKELNDELNKRLKRSEFMPFAPSVLYEKADEVFDGVEHARHTAEFMTITFNVKHSWRDKIGAVVHVDGTARPQLVKREKNPNYYDAIDEFYKLSGLPLVVNTSFNMHEEPIVCSVDDALRAFDLGAIDCLVINNKFMLTK